MTCAQSLVPIDLMRPGSFAMKFQASLQASRMIWSDRVKTRGRNENGELFSLSMWPSLLNATFLKLFFNVLLMSATQRVENTLFRKVGRVFTQSVVGIPHAAAQFVAAQVIPDIFHRV